MSEDGEGQKPAKQPAKEPLKVPGREALAPLPKRFYSNVSVESAGPGAGFSILLDGRPVRTPRKIALALPTRALAEAIAEEWAAQKEHIDPATMPLSRLAITALDGVVHHMPEVAAEIVAFAGSDLLCYRAEAPEELAHLQAQSWDPVLKWIEEELGVRFRVARGVRPVQQDVQTLQRMAQDIATYDALRLACVHVMTTLTGSAILALAAAKNRLSDEETWALAHVDEDWQIGRWGVDVEAKERRERRWADFRAADRFLKLLRA